MALFLFWLPLIVLFGWTLYALIVSLSYRASVKVRWTNYYVFESTLQEKLGYSHDVVDRQLAHSKGDKVKEAYDRAEYLGHSR